MIPEKQKEKFLARKLLYNYKKRMKHKNVD